MLAKLIAHLVVGKPLLYLALVLCATFRALVLCSTPHARAANDLACEHAWVMITEPRRSVDGTIGRFHRSIHRHKDIIHHTRTYSYRYCTVLSYNKYNKYSLVCQTDT